MSNNLNSGLLRWFASGSIIPCSRTLACAAAGLPFKTAIHPKNPEDFNSCLLLLESVPEIRSRLADRVSILSDPWADLVSEWGDIESMFLHEAGLNFTINSSAPNTHALLKKILSDDLTAAFNLPNDLRSQLQGQEMITLFKG